MNFACFAQVNHPLAFPSCFLEPAVSPPPLVPPWPETAPNSFAWCWSVMEGPTWSAWVEHPTGRYHPVPLVDLHLDQDVVPPEDASPWQVGFTRFVIDIHPWCLTAYLKKTMENKQLLPSLAIFWGKGIITHSLSYFWIKRACLYTKISGQSSPKLQTPSQAVPWIK